jgi:hypothetical protein
MDAFDQSVRLQRVSLARARSAAADIDRHHDGRMRDDDSDAGARVGVFGMANRQAWYVAEAILVHR